ncbi:MAG: branched-chain amino acid transporter AzlD [Epulopiscium sp.]|nr:branched-chain amino acid transporter AzlD [Candidatus Epulonipiscium sp.]
MILTATESFIMILIIAIMTFLTRVIPFILFPDNKETPETINYLGNVLPYASIGMLVIYCLKDISFCERTLWLPEIVSVLVIIIIHKWRKNTLLSIGLGTILYMLIVQFICK